MGVPQKVWFLTEKPIKMDDLEYPYFRKPPNSLYCHILGNSHLGFTCVTLFAGHFRLALVRSSGFRSILPQQGGTPARSTIYSTIVYICMYNTYSYFKFNIFLQNTYTYIYIYTYVYIYIHVCMYIYICIYIYMYIYICIYIYMYIYIYVYIYIIHVLCFCVSEYTHPTSLSTYATAGGPSVTIAGFHPEEITALALCGNRCGFPDRSRCESRRSVGVSFAAVESWDMVNGNSRILKWRYSCHI